MRHAAAVVAAAAAIAIVLILVLGEDETAEDTTIETPARTTGERPRTETVPQSPPPEREPDGVAEIERAVSLYVEAAERGEVDAEGLPTSDELSIRVVRRRGDRATALLAGGARLVLSRADGRWRVDEVVGGRVPAPTPPSNG